MNSVHREKTLFFHEKTVFIVKKHRKKVCFFTMNTRKNVHREKTLRMNKHCFSVDEQTVCFLRRTVFFIDEQFGKTLTVFEKTFYHPEKKHFGVFFQTEKTFFEIFEKTFFSTKKHSEKRFFMMNKNTRKNTVHREKTLFIDAEKRSSDVEKRFSLLKNVLRDVEKRFFDAEKRSSGWKNVFSMRENVRRGKTFFRCRKTFFGM